MPTYLTPGVYVEEVDTGPKPLALPATAVAAFVGYTDKAPDDDPNDPDGMKPRLVTNWAQFEQLYGSFAPGMMLPHAVYGYFNNGGSTAYITRIPHRKRPRLALGAASDSDKPALEVSRIKDDVDINVTVEEAEDGGFNLKVEAEGETESFDNLTLGSGPRNAADVVNGASDYVQVKVKADQSVEAPTTGTYPLEPTEPLTVTGADFTGSATARTGVSGLVIAEDATIVMVPDLITAATQNGELDLDLWKAVQVAVMNHCEGLGDRMALLDAPPGMNPQQIKEWRSDVAMYDSKFAAMYYPWIEVANPLATNGNKTIMVPPSGHVAGLWARTDETRGVWKAPANDILRGALNVELKITKGEQGILNPIGVNCIRPFGTRGIRVWGARTLSSDPSWKYLSVRRLFNMIETAILDGTQWVVFEPNDQTLWERVRRTITGMLLGLWRDGALFGASPDQAFFVKCDGETNPPESIELGQLITEIGIAPVTPAEFVIFRISQKAKEV